MAKETMFLSEISIHLCMIIHYIVGKHIVIIDYWLFLHKKNLKCNINAYFKVNRKQRIKMPKKGEYVRFKDYNGK